MITSETAFTDGWMSKSNKRVITSTTIWASGFERTEWGITLKMVIIISVSLVAIIVTLNNGMTFIQKTREIPVLD